MPTRLPPGEIALLLDRVKREGGLPDVAETLGEQFDALGGTTPLHDMIAQNAATNTAVLEALKAHSAVNERGVAAMEREAAAAEEANELEKKRIALSEMRIKSLWRPLVLAFATLITGAITGYFTGLSTAAGEAAAKAPAAIEAPRESKTPSRNP